MGWFKPHASFDQGQAALIDRCINCGSDQNEIKCNITMELGDGNYNTGPICKRCYSSYQLKEFQV